MHIIEIDLSFEGWTSGLVKKWLIGVGRKVDHNSAKIYNV